MGPISFSNFSSQAFHAWLLVTIFIGLAFFNRTSAAAAQTAPPAAKAGPASETKAPTGDQSPASATTPTNKVVAGWTQLFNGKDLTGWTPKIRGHQLGENYGNTFRVVDGLLTVNYDQYTDADSMSLDGKDQPRWEKFGHLFYDSPYSHYMLRCEYRFVGDQIKNGPGWAMRNNGLMLHGQDPKTMKVNQSFPVSIEVQLLGGNGKDKRSTLNLCTPGTHVVKDGKLFKPHCTNSNSKTFHGDDWVTVEVEVRGGEIIRHWVADEVVLEYTQPQYDPKDKDGFAQPLIKSNKGDLLLTGGTISIQSESHGTQFRKIELFELDPKSKYDPNKKPTPSKMTAVNTSDSHSAADGNWGHLTGKILVTGTAPTAEKENFGGNADAKTCNADPIDDNLIIGKAGELKDVVVTMYRKKSDAAPKIHPQYIEAMKTPAVIDNKNCRFVPHVVFVQTGQQLKCTNSDSVGHNCHGSTFNNEFNPSIKAGGSAIVEPTVADRIPGKIECSIHPWMDGVIVIRDDPYMTASREDGTFEIKNIPEGTWKFQFWHVKVGYMKKLDIPGYNVGRRGEIEVTIEKGKALDLGKLKFKSADFKKN